MKASKQVLSDISQLRSIIDQRLLYGLAYVEEGQILNGDGTGQNLNGIIPQATAYVPPIAIADLTMLDVMRLAMLQAALAEYPATGHVLNPIDWTTIELTKDTTGRYIIGNPQGTTAPTLWNLPSGQRMTQPYRRDGEGVMARKKAKLPKTLAGMKVPKALRKSDIVAALLPGPAEDEATVKRLGHDGARVMLIPENPALEPFEMVDGRILGKVVAVLRKL